MDIPHFRSWVVFFIFFSPACCYCSLEKKEVDSSISPYPKLEELTSTSTDDYRTAFHFQPPSNWMNDPNGPAYYNGIYHLFYQYNPASALWGNISWGHSVSIDLINWTPLQLALDHTDDFDINGCWSGSITILPGNRPVILYTGIDSEDKQVQNIAFPKNLSDPLLREWIKPAHNPIMSPVDGLDPSQFRDPTTGWIGSDGQWRVAVGAELNGHGLALLFRSMDFLHWERAKHPLHFSKSTLVWECPDFYPVSLEGKHGLDLTAVNSKEVKHVLKVSLQTTWRDYYILGRYHEENDTFVPDEEIDNYRLWSGMDFGKFYASKSFYDGAKQRRIVWAWSNESDSEADDVARGWSGIQTFPRTIWLDSNKKQLQQWPIEEIELLRRNEVKLGNVNIKTGEILNIEDFHASQADIEVDFELPSLEKAEAFDPTWALDPQKYCRENGSSVRGGIGPFGLLVLASEDFEEYTAVYFRVFKASDTHTILMCSEQERSSLRAGLYEPAYGGFFNLDLKKEKKISLRTLIDHSVIESFGGGGRACITARVYPSHLLTNKTNHYAFNYGSETVKVSTLRAWNIDKASINKLGEEIEGNRHNI